MWLALANDTRSEGHVSLLGGSCKSKCVLSTRSLCSALPIMGTQRWRLPQPGSVGWRRARVPSQVAMGVEHECRWGNKRKQSVRIRRYFGLVCCCSMVYLILTASHPARENGSEGPGRNRDRWPSADAEPAVSSRSST